MKEIYLENTTGSHNKYYQMSECLTGYEFYSTWGPIGSKDSKSRIKRYSMAEWDKILNSKLANGYVQVPLVTEDFKKDERWWGIKEKLEKLNQRVARYGEDGFDNLNEEREWEVNKDNMVIIYQGFFNTGKISKSNLTFANKLWKKYEPV